MAFSHVFGLCSYTNGYTVVIMILLVTLACGAPQGDPNIVGDSFDSATANHTIPPTVSTVSDNLQNQSHHTLTSSTATETLSAPTETSGMPPPPPPPLPQQQQQQQQPDQDQQNVKENVTQHFMTTPPPLKEDVVPRKDEAATEQATISANQTTGEQSNEKEANNSESKINGTQLTVPDKERTLAQADGTEVAPNMEKHLYTDNNNSSYDDNNNYNNTNNSYNNTNNNSYNNTNNNNSSDTPSSQTNETTTSPITEGTAVRPTPDNISTITTTSTHTTIAPTSPTELATPKIVKLVNAPQARRATENGDDNAGHPDDPEVLSQANSHSGVVTAASQPPTPGAPVAAAMTAAASASDAAASPSHDRHRSSSNMTEPDAHGVDLYHSPLVIDKCSSCDIELCRRRCPHGLVSRCLVDGEERECICNRVRLTRSARFVPAKGRRVRLCNEHY